MVLIPKNIFTKPKKGRLMTKKAISMSRRTLLTALPATGVALALPATGRADPALLDVLHELEGWQGWEASCVVAAKAYAAYRVREALGMELPDPEYARMHLDYQGQSFEGYQRTVWFERDMANGKVMLPPRPSASL